MSATDPLYVLALDFGGTKLTAALVNITHGQIIASERYPTPSYQGADASLQAIVQAAWSVIEKSHISIASISGIGISFGGPVSADRRSVLRSLHVANWDSFALPDRIAEIFNLPAFMDNDGNAAALGEWIFGAGKGCDNMLYIQVSTGIGSGMILGKQVYRGGGLAGEFGHLTVMKDGPRCACGKHGCIESLASGWALARDGRAAYGKASVDSPLNQLAAGHPESIDARIVIEAARRGDPLARPLISKSFTHLGIGISNALVLLDPQMVVLGGGITQSWDILYPALQIALAENLPPMFHNRTSLVISQLNGMETLYGAALLTQGY